MLAKWLKVVVPQRAIEALDEYVVSLRISNGESEVKQVLRQTYRIGITQSWLVGDAENKDSKETDIAPYVKFSTPLLTSSKYICSHNRL